MPAPAAILPAWITEPHPHPAAILREHRRAPTMVVDASPWSSASRNSGSSLLLQTSIYTLSDGRHPSPLCIFLTKMISALYSAFYFLDVCVSLDHLTFIQALASQWLVLGAAVPRVVTEWNLKHAWLSNVIDRDSFFADKLFEISSTFKGKVLKRYQLHKYHFSTNYTILFYALAVQIWFIRKKCFQWKKFVKIRKKIDMIT
jgi:hypothetical protein